MTIKEALKILFRHGWIKTYSSFRNSLYFYSRNVSIDYNDLLIISKHYRIQEITRTIEIFAVFVESRE